MFATVTFQAYTSPLKRLRRRCKNSIPTVSRVPLPNAFSFFHIVLEEEKAGVPWAALADAAGRFKKRLLLPDGMLPPPDSGLAAFQPQRLPTIALMNGALKSIAAMQLDPTQVRIAVIDDAGLLLPLIPKLVPFSCALTVVTKQKAPYRRLSEALLEQYGISLLLFETADARLNDSTLLIAPAAAAVPLTFGGVLLTNVPARRMNATILVTETPSLPPQFERLRPPGIDRLQFASALFECCAATELATLCAPLRLL